MSFFNHKDVKFNLLENHNHKFFYKVKINLCRLGAEVEKNILFLFYSFIKPTIVSNSVMMLFAIIPGVFPS